MNSLNTGQETKQFTMSHSGKCGRCSRRQEPQATSRCPFQFKDLNMERAFTPRRWRCSRDFNWILNTHGVALASQHTINAEMFRVKFVQNCSFTRRNFENSSGFPDLHPKF